MTSGRIDTLHAMGPTARWLVTAFLVTIGFGYSVGLVFVEQTTGVAPEGTVEQFRGNEDVPMSEVSEIKYRKDTLEMLNIVHAHVTSFALIYLAVGGIFLLSSYKARLKTILAVEPFVATILLFGGMLCLRYLGAGLSQVFALIMMIAGAATAVCFYLMVGLSLFDLWRPAGSRSAQTKGRS